MCRAVRPWLSRRIHAERELVADRLAAEATGAPRRLAQALAALADHHAALRAVPRPALAALEPQGGHLMSRIEQLLRPDRARSSGRLVFPLLGKKPVTLGGQSLTGGAFDVRATEQSPQRQAPT